MSTGTAVPPGTSGADPSVLAPYMFALMVRNISTNGLVAADHNAPGSFSSPGCVLASPSWPTYPGNVAGISEDYVFNWTRDAAITVSVVLGLASGQVPAGAAAEMLGKYVDFASACQSGGGVLGQAKYTPEGWPTGSVDESDGPALRVLTVLQGFAGLDAGTQGAARNVISADIAYLLNGARYQQPTVTHWEDTVGQSLFARAVQLRCLDQLLAQGPAFNIDVPASAQGAATWLGQQLPAHWSATANCYISVLDGQRLTGDPAAQYDPSVDPILACVYGDGIACTDPKLLSTAAQVRAQWSTGPIAYSINIADSERGIGPLIGRYIGDQYDGLSLTSPTGHPWAVSTCTFAQLYYQLAGAIQNGEPVPSDPLAATFLSQVGVAAADPTANVVAALKAAGDSMLNAVVYHSNYFELSEQFDQSTGFERSVSNLTWSYAAFLLALGARAKV
jgi:glucoamylase